MNELLDLKTDLNQISITGLKSIQNDFRLKKVYQRIQILAKKSTVFCRISNLIEKLFQKQDFETFVELINLTNAVLSVQNNIDNKPQSELNVSNTNINNYLTFSQLSELRHILDGSANSIWAELKNFYDENKLNDYRLFNDFMKILNSNYTYVTANEKFNIVTILSNYDERIIPILLEKFKTADNISKSNIVKIISNIGKQKYNNYYIKWIDEEENENVIANSIKALIYDKANLNFLLNLKPTKKKTKQARAYALAYMPDAEAHNEFKKYCVKDKEFLNDFIDDIKQLKSTGNISFLSEDEIIEMLLQCINDLKNKNINSSKEFNYLYIMIKCTSYYNSDNIVDALISVVESQIELKDSNNEEKKAVTALLNCKTKKAYKYLASIKNKFKNDYYYGLSFIASINLGYNKEKIFDEFAHLCFKESSCSKCIYNFLISILYFYEHKKDVNRFFGWNIKDFIKLDINNPIKWDKRWLKYTLDNDLIELSAFFIDEKTDNISEIKSYYLKYIQSLKNINIKSKYKNNQLEIDIIISSLVLGLFKVGAKEIAIENLPFISTCSYYRFYIDLYIKYLQKEDINLLNNLKWQNEYNKICIYPKWHFVSCINELINKLNNK